MAFNFHGNFKRFVMKTIASPSQFQSHSGDLSTTVNFTQEESGAETRGHVLYQRTLQPVNNFIKGFSQIEHEFRKAQEAENEFRLCLNGRYIPARDILEMPMEENY